MISLPLLYYLIAINAITFIIYGIDKWKARKNKWRIPESTLLLLAVFGGSIGAFLGMRVWRCTRSSNMEYLPFLYFK